MLCTFGCITTVRSHTISLPAELAAMLETYVEALNSPKGIPEIGSAWEQALKNTYQIATAKAIELYKSKMSGLSFPMDEGVLKKFHSEAREQATEHFKQLTGLDTDGDAYNKHLSQLLVSTYYHKNLYWLVSIK